MRSSVPSLVDLCVQLAIDNIRFLGDVGVTEFHLLDRILSHCTPDQLMHIENCTEDRDLSPVTDKLWKKFFKLQFGADSMNFVVEKMKQKNVNFSWRRLYKAKLQEREEATEKSLARIKKRYEEENAKKQSRQVQVCMKVPPSSKRSFYGGFSADSMYDTKSSLMKKARKEFVNCREVKNLASMKTMVHRNNRLV
ncbi:hypothetical protein M569_06188, partial [Genlisea aurea]